MILDLKHGWRILQDVHDTGERLGLFKEGFQPTVANQISEWDELPELKHLQLIYARQPYYGRELRYFNQAPWWYRVDFDVPEHAGAYAKLCFTNVDYLCKVWLNGSYLGAHEGYSMPFGFRVDDLIQRGQKNTLVVKVWSPWDNDVLNDRQDERTMLVIRNSIKGTYEHSDGFVQRDVNPVGIYGKVTLTLHEDICFDDPPVVSYTLSEDMKTAHVKVSAALANGSGDARLKLFCTERLSKERVAERILPVGSQGEMRIETDVPKLHLWNTWDRGGAWLYDLTVQLICGEKVVDTYTEAIGFRRIEMVRDAQTTRFLLNGKPFYVRGTSYFPDVYVSNMCYERYKRDLLNIRAAGFNMVRIHVHVDLPEFYELCCELGIGIMHDSEYNWTHPADDAFADRFIRVYLDTVRMLRKYCAMFCWICMNEPGLLDPMGRSTGRAMTINPGPRLYEAVHALDPTRPIIKGSFCEDDPYSGDSHNYTGSLNGPRQHYSDIYGTKEKLNTEYGFDAPACIYDLKKCPDLIRRLSSIEDRLGEIQHYQYMLLKYYTEHYRMQKYAPNSGYVQFLFSDLCPQSFYGLYDWWGLPKAGLDAILESNMPLGVFLKYSKTETDGIYIVNDSLEPLGSVLLKAVFTDEDGAVITTKNATVEVGADEIANVVPVKITVSERPHVNCALILMQGEKVICTNHYEDLFNMPEHVKGHPDRISHEIGMRTYFAD